MLSWYSRHYLINILIYNKIILKHLFGIQFCFSVHTFYFVVRLYIAIIMQPLFRRGLGGWHPLQKFWRTKRTVKDLPKNYFTLLKLDLKIIIILVKGGLEIIKHGFNRLERKTHPLKKIFWLRACNVYLGFEAQLDQSL